MTNNTPVKMSEAAKEARNRYNRNYYARNKDRIQKKRAECWERKAAEAAERKEYS